MKKVLSYFIALCLLVSCFNLTVSAKYIDNYGNATDNMEEDRFITSSKLLIKEGYCIGVKANTIPANAINLFDDNANIKFFDNDLELNYDSKLKTGDIVSLTDGKYTYDSKTICISGDIDCDGDEDVTDIAKIINNIVNGENVSELQFACGDVDVNGAINVSDVVNIRKSILNSENLNSDKVEFDTMEYFINENADKFKIQGRAYDIADTQTAKGGVGIYFPAVSIEFNAICEGDVYIKTVGNSANFRAIIDGVESGIIYGSGNIKIASSLSKGLHEIKVVSAVESAGCYISSVSLNGVLYNATMNSSKLIKFIGDSITCGASNTIKLLDNNNQPVLEDRDGKIARVCVKIISKTDPNVSYLYDIDYARYREASNCYEILDDGSGFTATYSFNDYTAMHQFYDKDNNLIFETDFIGQNNTDRIKYSTDSSRSYAYLTAKKLGYDWELFSASGHKLEQMYENYKVQYKRDTSLEYTSRRKPDIVVVNMDTNGWSNFNNYKTAMRNFLTEFRTENPNCKVIFSFGAMKIKSAYAQERASIRAAIEELDGEFDNVYAFEYTSSRDGGDGHPSVANDYVMANELAAFIKTIE